MSQKIYNAPGQAVIAQELVMVHGLDESQISFEGNDISPIFDYEAVCALTLKLTDIQSIDCWIANRGTADEEIVTAKCTVTVPDGRTRTCEGHAQLHEQLGNGTRIETFQQAEAVAQARAVRRGIRSVGVNLWNAHRKFVESGQIVTTHTDNDPRQPIYAEIHILATELNLIVDGEKSKYRDYISENYGGRTTAKDLDDVELHRLLINFRSLARLGRSKQAA